MIEYIAKKRLFHLYNEKISYYFYITEKGILQHLYFGKKLKNIDIESMTDLKEDWARTYFSFETNKEERYCDYYYYNHSLMELPTYGGMDDRFSPVIVKKNGRTDTDFRFHDYQIYSGKNELIGLPSFRLNERDAQSLKIILKDAYSDTYAYLQFTILENESAIYRNLEIINKNREEIEVHRALTCTLELPGKNFKLIHFPGDWCMERQVREDICSEGSKRIRSKLGRSSHEHNPGMFLCDLDANEDYGEVYGFSLVYSGNFLFDVHVSKWGTTRINFGIDDENFCFHLRPNESFVCPEAVLTFSDNGLNKASQTFHDIIRNYLLPKKNREIQNAILLNSWEGCYMNFNTDKIMEFIHQAKVIGAEMFVLDDGWFGKRNDDSSSLGDWTVNDQKVNLKKIIETCHNENLKFGLWFEPEMVNPDSDLFRKHPEWIVGRRDGDLALSRHQFVLDTANPAVVDYLIECVSKILDKYDIDYVKWDHNRNILNPYSEYLGEAKQGEFYHRLILGTYRLFDTLTSKYPHILFEGCASGGGRFDLGMLYYTPQIWCSDETDPIQRLFIQYGTSYIYPCCTMGAHVSKKTITCYRTKAEIALFGTYGFEFDPRKISQDEIKEVRQVNDIFHKIHENVICEGDLYRISSPFSSNFLAQICVSKDQKHAAMLFVNLKKENNSYRFIKAKGLNKETKYMCSFDKKIHTGDFLMTVGINLSFWIEEFSSFLILFDATEDSVL